MNTCKTGWLSFAIMAAVALQAARADSGRPSQSVLNEMGLGGLVVMSDEEASSIRGQGFKGGHGRSHVSVFGNSFATINTPFGSAHSENGYTGEGKHIAVGANLSVAGVKIESTGGHHGKPKHGKKFPKNGNKWGRKGGKPDMGWGGKPGMNGGHGGGHHGKGKPRVTSITFFAGGFSFAAAK